MLSNTSSANAEPNIDNGKRLYENNCIVCHGPQGHGDGVAASNLPKQPKNISEELNSIFETDAKLTRDVLKGKTGMPAFRGTLRKEDVADIFAYIRSINP